MLGIEAGITSLPLGVSASLVIGTQPADVGSLIPANLLGSTRISAAMKKITTIAGLALTLVLTTGAAAAPQPDT